MEVRFGTEARGRPRSKDRGGWVGNASLAMTFGDNDAEAMVGVGKRSVNEFFDLGARVASFETLDESPEEHWNKLQ